MKKLSKKEIKKFFKEERYRKQNIVIILDNLQYTRNVASIFRTAEAAGVKKIYLTGITPQPQFDQEFQHVSRKKEKLVDWEYEQNAYWVLEQLKKQGFIRIAVELTNTAIPLYKLKDIVNANDKICFVFGSEIHGLSKTTLKNCDESVFIPMYGKGASLNVAVCAGIILYSF
ncbi:MAG: rRNA methyltransferase [Candidatus Dojkabacteria bacterium]|nr:MAG: rRNA methyltransferase [Candidatus Dojkabacteria bacterium]